MEIREGDRGCYIEVIMDKYALPEGAEWVFAATRPKFNQAGLTWEQWKASHDSKMP